MQSESREILIYIHSRDKPKEDISIKTIANFFEHLQNILYQVCDQVEFNEFRKTGRYPKSVTEHCDLVLKNLVLGKSVDVAVGLSNSQMGLPFEGFEKSYGEQAISLTNEIFKIVHEKDEILPDLSPVITDEKRSYRILSEINESWPDENSKYIYDIGIGRKNLRNMNPSRKSKIEKGFRAGNISIK